LPSIVLEPYYLFSMLLSSREENCLRFHTYAFLLSSLFISNLTIDSKFIEQVL
jgi:hypothetical protein